MARSFDTIIDVRSPSEYAEDHVPGAINLPVLSDEERAQVGTLYHRSSPFDARKLGAALVFRNASNHIEASLSHHDGTWQPLVYCWRGGQRSGSFTWILQQIGWRAETLPGGYRSYRRWVTQALYAQPWGARLVQLGGYTGTAKTELLHHLNRLGVQILDLEGLANHRGSLLGAMPDGQPSQKAFESSLLERMRALDLTKPVLVEAESSKIGRVNLPPALWDAMKAAPWIEVTADLDARARYLSRAYRDILADTEALVRTLTPLRYHRGHALVDHWADLSTRGEKIALCASLASDHYDPAYERSKRHRAPNVLKQFSAGDLSADALAQVAEEIAAWCQTIEM